MKSDEAASVEDGAAVAVAVVTTVPFIWVPTVLGVALEVFESEALDCSALPVCTAGWLGTAHGSVVGEVVLAGVAAPGVAVEVDVSLEPATAFESAVEIRISPVTDWPMSDETFVWPGMTIAVVSGVVVVEVVLQAVVVDGSLSNSERWPIVPPGTSLSIGTTVEPLGLSRRCWVPGIGMVPRRLDISESRM
jgi:hypothetical protein